ncbi:phosphoribosylamine--glycine ligase [Chlorobium ferrooxidans DSM 13031]|uniref:Phosphoribosylamine--glycine ligase n=2 Tax=Chlorobium TaxID=1091 RepID=Q0YU04_9CHLB|nr:phosphoribosylamine--glycine ligase [Chlorobium ferrooxidans DSM 13031]
MPTLRAMNVLIIGSGAREHAMARAAAQSERVQAVFVAPGNGGTAMMGGKVHNVALKATDLDGLLQFAGETGVELTVVGPEQPLELGIVDLFRRSGKKIVGPTRDAARLESSKVFAKEFMQRHHIPTAGYRVFRDSASAVSYLGALPERSWPQVIKASGLCGGKGVIIAEDRDVALRTIIELFDDRIFGDAADEVVIEDFLKGEEASVFALTDGVSYRLFLSAQDHKRIGDGDTGKNTGGMGAYAPAPLVSAEVMRKVEERVIRPTLAGMASEGYPYTGFLYVGLMIDGGEPSVVEYNARLGDPETQVVLPLLKSDLIAALQASVDGDGRLNEVPFEMYQQSAATVVMASGGYPDHYETGKPVTIADGVESLEGCMVFHAGTSLDGARLLTAGGRVFSVTALGDTLRESIDRAYEAVEKISFEGAYYRSDIGAKAL